MKTFCILEQGQSINDSLTLKKKADFTTDFCDFYRLNWYQDGDSNAFITHKNITYSEGRSLLYDTVPKQYEYYIMTDDDVVFSAPENVNIAKKIRDLLAECNSIAGTFYDPTSWYLNQGRNNQIDFFTNKYFPIRGYDQQVQILSCDFAEVVLPIIYHGSDKSMWYAQWACHHIFPLKQICFTEIQVSNTRNAKKDHLLGHPQYLDEEQLVNLFNADIKDQNLIIKYAGEIQSENLEYYHRKIDKTYCSFSLSDLEEIYNIDNYFFIP